MVISAEDTLTKFKSYQSISKYFFINLPLIPLLILTQKSFIKAENSNP